MAVRRTQAKRKSSTRPAGAAPKKAGGKKAAAKKPARRGAGRKAGGGAAADPHVERIQHLIDLMVQSGAVEVEMKDGDVRLRVRLKEEHQGGGVVHYAAAPMPQHAPVHGADGSGLAGGTAAGPVPAGGGEGDVFLSPMVGTFYRAASPEAEPFAHVGDHVEPDSTLCIIEAMKVMNEIKAECSGEISAILVENGAAVEFGTPLFRIRRH